MSDFTIVCLEILSFILFALLLGRLKDKFTAALDLNPENSIPAWLIVIAPVLIVARVFCAINTQSFSLASFQYAQFLSLLLISYGIWMLFLSARQAGWKPVRILWGLLPCLPILFLKKLDIHEKADRILWILSLELLLYSLVLTGTLMKSHTVTVGQLLRQKAPMIKRKLRFWGCLQLAGFAFLIFALLFTRFYLEPISKKAWAVPIKSCQEVYEISGIIYWNREDCSACEQVKPALSGIAHKEEQVIYSFDTNVFREDPLFQQVLDDFGVTEVPFLTLSSKGEILAQLNLVSTFSYNIPTEEMQDIFAQYKALQ